VTFLDEAARQMTGAWKMALAQADWEEAFDRSTEGVFGSFRAALIVAPLAALASATAAIAARRAPDLSASIYASAPTALLVVMDLLTLALDWLASLALLIGVAHATGATRNAGALIAGYNWTLPIITAAQLPPLALMSATSGAAWGAFAALPALALSFTLLWGVIRRGLGAGAAPTIAIMVALFIIGALADEVVTRFARLLLSAQS
jgi:hypothetical protein